MLHAVIMAGGSGKRFWPYSRRNFPKQLLSLTGDQTMIQQTVQRCAGMIEDSQIWIATSEQLSEPIAGQLPQIPQENLLCEPCGRNTAPCIGLAAVHLLHVDPEAVMLVMPSDHVIGPDEVFRKSVTDALPLLERNPETHLLFGVPPNYPATGFGYIERGQQVEQTQGIYEVHRFREKPDRETAEKFVREGTFFWNCGIFLWSARTILKSLEEFEPEMHSLLMQYAEKIRTPEQKETLETLFPQMKSVSIDYAVLERAKQVAVIEAPFDWDDVGSWQAMARLRGENEDGNTIMGEHVLLDTKNCIVSSREDHIIATVGLEDLLIVHTKDATLVTHRGNEGGIRQLVQELEERGKADVL